MIEALAQAIPVGVQHHSKPRFGRAVVQERLCILRDVAAHGVHGNAWDVGVDFWGHLSVKEGLCSFCLV